MKSHTDLLSFFEKQKKSPLTEIEKEILEEREIFAQIYLKQYADESAKTHISAHPPATVSLSATQQLFLEELLKSLKTRAHTRESLQADIFNILQTYKLKAGEVFKPFYRIMIGKDFGPKAADIILDASIEKTQKHLIQALNSKKKQQILQLITNFQH